MSLRAWCLLVKGILQKTNRTKSEIDENKKSTKFSA